MYHEVFEEYFTLIRINWVQPWYGRLITVKLSILCFNLERAKSIGFALTQS